MLTVTPLLRDIKEHNQGWNRNVVHYTQEVFQIHNVYQCPNRPRNTQYSLEYLGNPPQVIMNARVNFQQVQVANNLGNAPRLFFYNELTRVRGDVGKPMMHTHIVPNTRFRALQLARYV